jgi:glucose/arabinose dehydrogenase
LLASLLFLAMVWVKRIIFGFLLFILLIAGGYLGYLLLREFRASRANNRPVAVMPVVETGEEERPLEELAAMAQATAVANRPVEQIRLIEIVSGLDRPIALTHAYDDRLFILEQTGTIRVIVDGILLPEPFLDIKEKVRNDTENIWDEQGLLGLVFHPRYQENGRFFINYTSEEEGGSTILARYEVDANDPNRADPTSETIILNVGQPYADHNAGHLQFGADGFLYMALGDGGEWGDPRGNGQNTSTLLGNLLRLDVDSSDLYAVPASNPFAGDSSKRNEIWVYGMRNPWRFSFDRLTGDLYIADVGQANWEELDFLPAGQQAGANMGWNTVEGPACYDAESCDRSGFVEPIVTYDHSRGCAIVGGYVYRGTQLPRLAGSYFFADFCQGTIWSLMQRNGEWAQNEVYHGDIWVSSFGEDVNGELYVLDHRGGIVYQIRP